MFVFNQQFLIHVIQKAEHYHLVDCLSNIEHFCTEFKGQQIYFRRVLLPKFDIPEEQKFEAVRRVTNQLQQQLLISQANISKNIFRYDKIIFSYPYACFFHEPFQSTVAQVISKNLLSYPQKIQLMIELTKGVKQLNQKKIAIRCLHPSIIVFNRSKSQTVFDIMFTDPSSFLWVGRKYINKRILQNNGYVAPEVLQAEDGGQKFACDAWSLGIIFYQILFSQIIDKAILMNSQEQLRFPCQAPEWLNSFISSILKISPKQRLGICDILKTLEKASLCAQIHEKVMVSAKIKQKKSLF